MSSSVDEEWMAYMKMQTQDRTFAFATASSSDKNCGMNNNNNHNNNKFQKFARAPPSSSIGDDDDGQKNKKRASSYILPPQPECDELNISTKTKALFLNQEVDIHDVFWAIPVIEYWKPTCGVVKKQMKIVSKTPEELADYLQRLEQLSFYREQIIRQINTVNVRRSKYKDERKLSVGISQKDLLNARGKKKNAFYNCFALILRIEHESEFREIHVKIFNTGKMEIPGVLNNSVLDTVKRHLLNMLRPLMLRKRPDDGGGGSKEESTEEESHSGELVFLDNRECDGVLINSNFTCGYNVDRDRLYSILRSDKYGLEAAYDSCSYPGIKCKFYFNEDWGFDRSLQRGTVDHADRNLKLSELGKTIKYTEVSFMIFRTGSCLIVGNCSEKILTFVYDFIKQLLADEYEHICVQDIVGETRATGGLAMNPKKTKPRKKTVDMTMAYRQEMQQHGGSSAKSSHE